jgi:AmmeMemoRadiSam system protein B
MFLHNGMIYDIIYTINHKEITMKILQASVAGMFYPNDPKELREMIQKMLAAADATLPVPKAIIAPHAGYVYSGSTAAAVYACLHRAKQRIKRVVLLGPAHRYPFRGLAMTDADYFATPLGEIAIDKNVPSQVQIINEAYYGENSLETQLPFLQEVLEDFKLIPILVGDVDNAQIVEVLEKLWGGKETLIVISSDLSHYLDYDTAKNIDASTIDAILNLQPQDIGYEQACGRKAINALLTIAVNKKLKPKLITACSSGDTAGAKDAVVGYAGFHFYANNK